VSSPSSRAAVSNRLGVGHILLLAGVAMLILGLPLSPSANAGDVLINLAAEVVGIALTVGLIAQHLARRDQQQQERAVQPAMRALLSCLDKLKNAYTTNLATTEPTRADVDFYLSRLKSASVASERAIPLLSPHQSELAADLVAFLAALDSLESSVEQCLHAFANSAADRGDCGRNAAAAAKTFTEELDAILPDIRNVLNVSAK
jgi:hypothetical protein